MISKLHLLLLNLLAKDDQTVILLFYFSVSVSNCVFLQVSLALNHHNGIVFFMANRFSSL